MCNNINSNSFSLLQNIFLDTRGLCLQYFSDWQEDISAIDNHIRKQLLHSEKLYAELQNQIKTLSIGVIYAVEDALRLQYVLFRGEATKQDFYCIGPFRTVPFDTNDFSILKRENHLEKTSVDELKTILSKAPSDMKRTEVLGIARHILLSFYHIEEPPVNELIWHKDSNDTLQYTPEQNSNGRIKQIEEIYLHENKLFGFVSEGNYAKAMREGNFFIQRVPERSGFKDLLSSHRTYLYSANTTFRKAAQSVGIHPYHQDEISQKFAKKISLCVSRQQLDTLYLEMIEEYCRLCREYPNRKYSRSVRIITNYISFHLSEDLTPDTLAQAINFSPNYISRKIKEETGMSLMSYITEQRIMISKRLFKETAMTVKEISIYVGISDWNYFTKLFKKSVGTTPSEFRKQQHMK